MGHGPRLSTAPAIGARERASDTWRPNKAANRVAGTGEEPQRIRREAKVIAGWDDHDFGLNDGGADMPFKTRAKELFLEFHRVGADDPRRTREGLYHAEVMGPPGQQVQVIVLDTRWFHSTLERAAEA